MIYNLREMNAIDRWYSTYDLVARCIIIMLDINILNISRNFYFNVSDYLRRITIV